MSITVCLFVCFVCLCVQTSSWDECLLEPPKQSSATASSLLMQEPPALDIPKELFAIVDFIERNGIDQVGGVWDILMHTSTVAITVESKIIMLY